MEQEQLILKKLDKMEKNIEEIKEHIIDEDTVLTIKEEQDLEENLKELKEGKSSSLEEIKKDRKDNA